MKVISTNPAMIAGRTCISVRLHPSWISTGIRKVGHNALAYDVATAACQ